MDDATSSSKPSQGETPVRNGILKSASLSLDPDAEPHHAALQPPSEEDEHPERPVIRKRTSSSKLRDSNGWDGKLRLPPKQAVLTNPEALSDPENFSDDDAPSVEQIAADEDLIDDYDPKDTTEIDLVHCRINSIPSLNLARLPKLEKICLRQNQISHIDLPECLASTLTELDLYDNLISHIKGVAQLTKLTTLDLSFNKIKTIPPGSLSPLTALRELYLVSNRISTIPASLFEHLTSLSLLELAANRIRVIENLESCVSLRELWLGKNKITEIGSNLSTLHRLRQLDLKSNRLTSISGLESLTNLEELYLSHNGITSLAGLPATLTSLRVLDISSNKITALTNIAPLVAIEELWASDNQLASFAEVERELADKENLETVYFEGNPLQTNGTAVYRNKIRLCLPRIKQIDATFVRVS